MHNNQVRDQLAGLTFLAVKQWNIPEAGQYYCHWYWLSRSFDLVSSQQYCRYRINKEIIDVHTWILRDVRSGGFLSRSALLKSLGGKDGGGIWENGRLESDGGGNRVSLRRGLNSGLGSPPELLWAGKFGGGVSREPKRAAGGKFGGFPLGGNGGGPCGGDVAMARLENDLGSLNGGGGWSNPRGGVPTGSGGGGCRGGMRVLLGGLVFGRPGKGLVRLGGGIPMPLKGGRGAWLGGNGGGTPSNGCPGNGGRTFGGGMLGLNGNTPSGGGTFIAPGPGGGGTFGGNGGGGWLVLAFFMGMIPGPALVGRVLVPVTAEVVFGVTWGGEPLAKDTEGFFTSLVSLAGTVGVPLAFWNSNKHMSYHNVNTLRQRKWPPFCRRHIQIHFFL